MAINERLIHTASASDSGGGNQQEGMVMHLDAADDDSYDGSGTVWYDIKDYEFTPAVNPAEHFNTVLYTGTGANQSITGFGFNPDLIWVKRRDTTVHHHIFDTLRGNYAIYSGLTDDQDDFSTAIDITSSNEDGFDVIGVSSALNTNNGTYVAWGFKAGGTAVSNTDGDITSQVSANNDLGFSIATYTGTGTSGDTFGHGLDVKPDMAIIKETSASGNNWHVYINGVTTDTKDLRLNSNNGLTTVGTKRFVHADIDANVIALGDSGGTNGDNSEYVAYCFASKRGVSKVGSYTGTGSAGNKVYTGFQPAWVMIKNTSSSSSNWMIYDIKRDTDGTINAYLEANTSDAEATASTATVSPNADGFTLGNSNSIHLNRSGHNFVYLAFASEKPSSLTPSRADFTEGTVTTGAEIELDANDYSGSGNWLNTGDTSGYDGTISGATYVNDGESDYFDFDGSNDYVSLSGNLNSSTKAFEIWLSPDSFSSDSWAFQQGDGQGVENYLRVYSSGLQVRMGNQTVTHTYSTTNRWIHVVGTHKTGNGFEFYLNGDKVKETTSSLTALSNDYFHIGARRNTTLGGYFNGKIGIVRVYDFALTGTQVKANYDATYGLYQYANLVLHLDAGDDTTVSTSTWSDKANSNDGTLTNFSSTLTDFYEKELGNWIEFDGSNDVVTIPHSSGIDIGSSGFSAEAWVYNEKTSGTSSIISNLHTTPTTGYTLRINNGTDVMLFIYNSGTQTFTGTASSSVSANTWNHLLFTVASNSSGAAVKLYINGELSSVSGTISAAYGGSGNTVELGRYPYSHGTRFLDGKIGQVRIYSSALTADQVMQNYRFTKNDYPNGNNATGVSSSSFNTYGYFNVPVGLNNIAFPFNFKKDQTLVWWAKHGTKTTADSASRYRYYMFDMKTATYSYWHARVDRHATNGYQFQLSWRQDSSNYVFATDVIDTLVNQDDWNMYACYFTGTEGMYYSVNGGNWSSGTTTTNVGTSSTFPEGNFLLGKLWSNGSYYSNPNPYDISDIKVFDKVLSSDELSSEYSKGQFGNN